VSAPQEPAKIFRQASLDRLTSPDQLDRLLQVLRPAAWAALIGSALLLLSGVAWGVTGRIPVKVMGQGILLKSGGIYEVVTGSSGRVMDVAVSVGEQVHEGQVVARISQPELAEKTLQAKIAVQHARTAHEQIMQFARREQTLQANFLTERRAYVQQSIEAAEKNVAWFDDKVATQRELVNEGRLTKQTLITTLQDRNEAVERIRLLRSDLSDIDVKWTQANGARQREEQQARSRLAEAEAELARLEREGSAATEVVSPYTGRIIELTVEQGSVINRGDPLVSLDLTGRTVKELEAVIYVAAREGKRVKPGMSVHIAPATVKPAEYGHLLGKVTYVSDFPTTTRGMQRVLKNEALAEALAGENPPHELHADLIIDPDTPSRYRWTSSTGPPMRIQSGTMCTAEVSVEDRRPIEMAMPLLRRLTAR
jgi:HlyD family secretion protein